MAYFSQKKAGLKFLKALNFTAFVLFPKENFLVLLE